MNLHDFQELAKSSDNKPIVTIGPSATIAESNGSAEVDGFRVQKRRERNSSGGKEAKKMAGSHTSTQGKTEVKAETRNSFVPLRSANMGFPEPEARDKQDEQLTSANAGRSPPYVRVLTASANLMRLQMLPRTW
jgi:hypothetical protein